MRQFKKEQHASKNNSSENSGSACYNSVQSFWSFHLLLENVGLKVCTCDGLRDVFYGYESCCVTSNVAQRLRVFENSIVKNVHTEGRGSNRRMEKIA
jgi:hypothetical protein